ncbi:hypothetical protein DFH09DRAFT_1069802 [Mycena vulgaris]|nr:hypothetical protein DFH09DRAFT_1069802 [Mycena vulgaris]
MIWKNLGGSSFSHNRNQRVGGQGMAELQTYDYCGSFLPTIMGSRTAPSRKTLEESSTYKPRLSKEEKAKRARSAVAAHYRNNPEMREKKKMQMREAHTAKKLAKRKWDPPKRPKEHSKVVCRNRDISGSDGDNGEAPASAAEDEQMEYLMTFKSEMMGDQSADESNTLEASVEDEEVASQVLTSMYMARQQQMQEAAGGDLGYNYRRPSHSSKTPVLPPSSPPPPSPEDIHHRRPPVPRKSWVSPGEWDEPGSPLPHGAYERMPWPRLFKSLFGLKGDAEPDAEELEELGLKGNEF